MAQAKPTKAMQLRELLGKKTVRLTKKPDLELFAPEREIAIDQAVIVLDGLEIDTFTATADVQFASDHGTGEDVRGRARLWRTLRLLLSRAVAIGKLERRLKKNVWSSWLSDGIVAWRAFGRGAPMGSRNYEDHYHCLFCDAELGVIGARAKGERRVDYANGPWPAMNKHARICAMRRLIKLADDQRTIAPIARNLTTDALTACLSASPEASVQGCSEASEAG